MGGGLQYHSKLEDLLIESCDELINGPERMETPNFTLIAEESGLHQSGQTTGMVGRPYIIGNIRDLMLPKLMRLLQGLEGLLALNKLIVSYCSSAKNKHGQGMGGEGQAGRILCDGNRLNKFWHCGELTIRVSLVSSSIIIFCFLGDSGFRTAACLLMGGRGCNTIPNLRTDQLNLVMG